MVNPPVLQAPNVRAETGVASISSFIHVCCVLIKTFLEWSFCHTCICFLFPTLVLCDGGFVDDTVHLAPAPHWAIALAPSAVAPGVLSLDAVFPQSSSVVARNCLGHVWHSLVGNLDCLSIEDFVQWMVGWEGSVQQGEELLPHLGPHVHGVGEGGSAANVSTNTLPLKFG